MILGCSERYTAIHDYLYQIFTEQPIKYKLYSFRYVCINYNMYICIPIYANSYTTPQTKASHPVYVFRSDAVRWTDTLGSIGMASYV